MTDLLLTLTTHTHTHSVANTASGSDIVWQFIDKDLRVQDSGRWCIQLDTKAATLKCVRWVDS